jgi:hypothetical protein
MEEIKTYDKISDLSKLEIKKKKNDNLSFCEGLLKCDNKKDGKKVKYLRT